MVVKDKVTVVENNTTKDSGEGFQEINKKTKEITFSDAKKVTSTKVAINKLDITGEEMGTFIPVDINVASTHYYSLESVAHESHIYSARY